MTDKKPDIAKWVDEAALAIAQPLLALELDDELIALPVYRP